ncbi:MAG: uroporphyrinogen decarboxylase family protein [Saccharofermentanales bacterium]
MKEMTKRERVLRTINLQETDRTPVYDVIDNDGMREYYGKAKLTPENAWQLEYAAIKGALDMARGVMISEPNPGMVRVDDDGIEWYHAKDTCWIQKRPFDDVDSLAKWVERNIEKTRKFQPDKAYGEQMTKYRIDTAKNIGDDTVVVGMSDVGMDFACHRVGIELFSYFINDEPQLASDWLEELNLAEIRRAKVIADAELEPVTFIYSDIAFKTGLFLTPSFLRKEFFPRLKRLNNAYQEAGVKCLYHSDGNLMEVMDDLIAADIDGINPMEVMAGMDIKVIKEKYGDKIFITGGIDVSQLMAFGTPDEVREACMKAIDDSGGTGYFLGSTTELHPAVKVENIVAMVEVAHTYKVKS